ncbi:hypothetical protein BACCAP_00310 [Pseudoflavonifractor capillosus ATCC 29799]|uniref:Uncharacterized protein n=1 Tax=Pseudoflavonifractor capillosus ATCC 29799 TaxID=411467 RepID=A6NQ40_9FIRM|nr:hypothetical protein BACCAP_00310 [Pseudoflavonifractor capillosus ATCC 29799]
MCSVFVLMTLLLSNRLFRVRRPENIETGIHFSPWYFPVSSYSLVPLLFVVHSRSFEFLIWHIENEDSVDHRTTIGLTSSTFCTLISTAEDMGH